MKYRRNMDERILGFTRQLSEEPNAIYQLARNIIRSGQYPELPPSWPNQTQATSLARFFEFIDEDYWMQYLTLIINLLRMGIAFELRPTGRHCGCEYDRCDHISDNSHCFNCGSSSLIPLGDYYNLATTRVYWCNCGRRYINPPANIRCDCDTDQPLELAEPESQLSDVDYNNRPQVICTQCRDIRPIYSEGGPCMGFPWRGYEDMLGGLCDHCMAHYPPSFHSHVCQCADCNNGIGPLIILRSRLLNTEQLNTMLLSYNDSFNDRYAIKTAFYLNQDNEYTEQRWRERHPRQIPFDEISLSCIELRRDGSYRLRQYEHHNDTQILPRFLAVLEQKLISNVPQAAKDLFRIHMFGRDFSLHDLVYHLGGNRSPNMQEFVIQVYHHIRDFISFDLIFDTGSIDPNAYFFECAGIWYAGNDEEYPVRLSFDRNSMGDDLTIHLLGSQQVRKSFNRRTDRDVKIATELGWALDRAQRPSGGGQIASGRLLFLMDNLCPHVYQKGDEALGRPCPYCK